MEKAFDQMATFIDTNATQIYAMQTYNGPGDRNSGDINDPLVNEYYQKINAIVAIDRNAGNALHKELMKYVLDQAWVLPRVVAPYFSLWWPWLKNYSGECLVGYAHAHFFNWVWIDQELKKSMGY